MYIYSFVTPEGQSGKKREVGVHNCPRCNSKLQVSTRYVRVALGTKVYEFTFEVYCPGCDRKKESVFLLDLWEKKEYPFNFFQRKLEEVIEQFTRFIPKTDF